MNRQSLFRIVRRIAVFHVRSRLGRSTQHQWQDWSQIDWVYRGVLEVNLKDMLLRFEISQEPELFCNKGCR